MINRLQIKIASIETQKGTSEEAKKQLAKVVVRDLFVKPLNQEFGFTLTNDTSQAILFYYCSYEVTSPGRKLPWVDSIHQADIEPGLEPGMSRRLAYFDTSLPRDRDDLQLAIEILRIDGRDGKPTWDATGYSDEKLQALQSDLAELLENRR